MRRGCGPAALLLPWAISGCAAPRAPAAGDADALGPGEHGTFSVPDWPDREYILHVPSAAEAAGAPVVYAFHGGGGDKDGVDRTSCPGGVEGDPGCMIAVADAAGTLLVMPDGVDKPGVGKRSWNAGGGEGDWRCVGGEACATGSDDVAYVDALRAEVERAVAVDTARVYATGISNGAAMSHRLACERAEVFAALAPVAGANQAMAVPGCEPAEPVPVLHLHGTADACWGWDGAIENSLCDDAGEGAFVAVEDSAAFWRTANGCTGVEETAVDDTEADGTTTTRARGTGCAADTELWRIDGGGHTWPGGWQYLPVASIGPVAEDYSGNAVIWNFFDGKTRGSGSDR